MKENNNKILLSLVQKFIHSFKLERTLFLSYSDFLIFEGLPNFVMKTLYRGQSIFTDTEKYDLIIGNLPIRMPKREWIDKNKGAN